MAALRRSNQYDTRPERWNRPFFRSRAVLVVVAVLCLSPMARVWSQAHTLHSRDSREHTNAIQLDFPHIVVVKSARKLYLCDGGKVIRSYPITLGRDPVGQKMRAGDGRTPIGRFRICTKNSDSANYRFLGISYPDRSAAQRGLHDGLLSPGEALAITQAHNAGRCPSWTTALGGGVGLHGSSSRLGLPTAGCIALADQYVAELFDVLRIGDEIEILP